MSKKKYTYCNECRKKRKKGWLFCYKCGSELINPKKVRKLEKKRKGKEAGKMIASGSTIFPGQTNELHYYNNGVLYQRDVNQNENSEQNASDEIEKKTLEFKDIREEVLKFVTHLNKDVFSSLLKLITSPGKTLNGFVEKGKYKNAVAYFCISISIYSLLTHWFFEPNKFKYLLSTKFPPHVEIFVLLTILIGIAVSGFVALGWYRLNGKTKDKKNDYSFGQVFMISLNIYGTNYFLAPIVVIICNIFSGPLEKLFNPHSKHDNETLAMMARITDIPLALFMVYMVLRLIMVRRNRMGFNKLWWRFILFIVLAGSYYYYMLPLVLKLVKFIQTHVSDGTEP